MIDYDFILSLFYIVPAAIIAIVLHELAHGLVSYALGDPTPKLDGRLSLNPAKHLDLIGAICLILFKFGWAKPVIINPSYYKNKKWGIALVSLAGPVMNFSIAFISALIYYLFYYFGISEILLEIPYMFFGYLALINIGLGLFNLIPIPPLDGSKILTALLPDRAYYQYMKYQRYGSFFLLGLILLLSLLERLGYPSLLNDALMAIFNLFIEFWYFVIH